MTSPDSKDSHPHGVLMYEGETKHTHTHLYHPGLLVRLNDNPIDDKAVYNRRTTEPVRGISSPPRDPELLR